MTIVLTPDGPLDVSTTLVGRRARDGVHGIDGVHALLPDHDAAVLMVPQTDQTRGLVDARFLVLAVQAAYRRTTYLGTAGQPGARVKLMDAWGRYCASGAAGAKVVPITKARAQ